MTAPDGLPLGSRAGIGPTKLAEGGMVLAGADVLVKATLALARWVSEEGCKGCPFPTLCPAGCPLNRLQSMAGEGARAVLEAAESGSKALLEQVLALEREAHRLWDAAFQNIAFGRPTFYQRQCYIEQTYQATDLHRQAVELIETALARAEKRGVTNAKADG